MDTGGVPPAPAGPAGAARHLPGSGGHAASPARSLPASKTWQGILHDPSMPAGEQSTGEQQRRFSACLDAGRSCPMILGLSGEYKPCFIPCYTACIQEPGVLRAVKNLEFGRDGLGRKAKIRVSEALKGLYKTSINRSGK